MSKRITHEHIKEKIISINNEARRTFVRKYDESGIWSIYVYIDFKDTSFSPNHTFIGDIDEAYAFLEGVLASMRYLR